MINNIVVRTVAAVAAAGAMIGIGAGTASASTARDATAAYAPSYSKRFTLHNETAGLTFDLIKVEGPNEGAAEPGTAMAPGQAQAYEVQYNFARLTTVDATYLIHTAQGYTRGEVTIRMEYDWTGLTRTSVLADDGHRGFRIADPYATDVLLVD